jgi:hypothetical protein
MTAFHVNNRPRLSHEFNFDTIGIGERCPNQPVRETQVSVRMPVAVSRDLLASQVDGLKYVVDTGATASLISGEVAAKLGQVRSCPEKPGASDRCRQIRAGRRLTVPYSHERPNEPGNKDPMHSEFR